MKTLLVDLQNKAAPAKRKLRFVPFVRHFKRADKDAAIKLEVLAGQMVEVRNRQDLSTSIKLKGKTVAQDNGSDSFTWTNSSSKTVTIKVETLDD